jgi:hypothetical protein
MPIKRRELIRRLGLCGFEGPFGGSKHQAMKQGELKIALPNPHGSQNISDRLLGHILRQAGVSREEWDQTGEK